MESAEAQGTWRLDLEGELLWRGAEAVRLRPKSFTVLRALVAQAGRVVRMEEILQAVWPDTTISDGVLAVCIHELRTALGDTAPAPQYIQTVPRRGYRWIGPRLTADPPPRSAVNGLPATALGPRLVVGREAECSHLHAWLEQARRGTRQVGFITGEAGIGKTALVDAWLAQVASEPGLVLARGQCAESYGAGEPYLPVLAALGRLGRGPDGAWLVAALAQHAPSWLVQMPGLLSTAALEAVQRRTLGPTRERMLRELAEAVEALSAERLLVLVLEDLHWSDAATLALVAYLARRQEPARFLLLGTYRPEAARRQGPSLRSLRLDLQRRARDGVPGGALGRGCATGRAGGGPVPPHRRPSALPGHRHGHAGAAGDAAGGWGALGAAAGAGRGGGGRAGEPAGIDCAPLHRPPCRGAARRRGRQCGRDDVHRGGGGGGPRGRGRGRRGAVCRPGAARPVPAGRRGGGMAGRDADGALPLPA